MLEVIPARRLTKEVHFSEQLTAEQRNKLEEIVRKNELAFGLDGRLGTHDPQVEINLRPNTQEISLTPYSASPAKREVIDKQIDDWLRLEVIEPAKSAWGFPVVVVYRNSKPRVCIDYRRLNAVSIPDEYPLPKQTDILHALKGSQWLTTLDALAGFTQLSIREEDRAKTAFRCHRSHYQFKRLPFGFRNGPSVFQRVMNTVLAPFLWIFALVYIDDIVVYSTTFEDHCRHLDQVFGAIQEAGITLSPNKCFLGYQSLLLLGQKVSRLGLSTHKEKVDAIIQLEPPKNIPTLQTFLGMMTYFASYIPFYAWIVAPLFKLLRKSTTWTWGDAEQKAFNLAKQALASAPVMAYPIIGKPFRLYTDVYDVTRGDIWDKTDFEETIVHVERVIAYWSRILKEAERNYSPTEREALALKEVLVKFQVYLEGSEFIAITDHAALTWSRTYNNVNRRLMTWGLVFSAYPGMHIVHRAGRVHDNADPVSRLRRPIGHQTSTSFSISISISPIEVKKFMEAYEEDLHFGKITEALRSPHNPLNPPYAQYQIGNNGLIYFIDSQEKHRLCVPKALQLEIIKENHDDLNQGAHAGQTSSIYYWPKMANTIQQYVYSCDICQKAGHRRHGLRGFLQPIPIPQQPFEVLTMDFIMDLPPSDAYNAILVIIDKLTKYAHFIPCTTQINEEETAKLFHDHIWCHYGLPRQIITDRDSRWTGAFWEHLVSMLGIKRALTTAYHPQADGQTEIMNQTAEIAIRAFTNPAKDDWVKILSGFAYSYNTSTHTSTNQTPAFLLRGFQPLTTSDLLAQTSERIHRPAQESQSAEDFKNSMDTSIELAKDALRVAQAHQQKYYNENRSFVEFEPGDLVLINPHSLRLLKRKQGKGDKLNMRYEGPFEVLEKVSSVAYRIRLPGSYRIHPVINIAHLESYKASPPEFGERPVKHIPRQDFEQMPEYEIEKIVEERFVKRGNKRTKQYLVRWLGYGLDEDRWKTEKELKNAPEILKQWRTGDHGTKDNPN
ncbi:putative Transposon Tf2-1 polyprotein [Rhizoctonia solani 123E]|uniref:Putative Transposon Tf2-1 polyprotein n=1 Tax=Rhizoctonia solani 123E TaxID=1423351 RepID=A0A074RF28_9AGAM|nr:putative Transposon Tf2-1 polyprotein [Rhizoctonia solani 123E]